MPSTPAASSVHQLTPAERESSKNLTLTQNDKQMGDISGEGGSSSHGGFSSQMNSKTFAETERGHYEKPAFKYTHAYRK